MKYALVLSVFEMGQQITVQYLFTLWLGMSSKQKVFRVWFFIWFMIHPSWSFKWHRSVKIYKVVSSLIIKVITLLFRPQGPTQKCHPQFSEIQLSEQYIPKKELIWTKLCTQINSWVSIIFRTPSNIYEGTIIAKISSWMFHRILNMPMLQQAFPLHKK